MDISEILSAQSKQCLGRVQGLVKDSDADDEKKIEAAKGFESVLIQKLTDAVKESIVSWDDEEDSASEQVEGMFWMELGQEISNQGGFGLWKDIYKSISQLENKANDDKIAGLSLEYDSLTDITDEISG